EVRLFRYVPQANCLLGKTNYAMKLGLTKKFRTLPKTVFITFPFFDFPFSLLKFLSLFDR
ncbi:hypothetical protein, partial [Turicimonas muris]|uniref:hypothetical protein n=1 Tax=Turicimonas muris TaxID=1796652 RepID=UPI0026069E1D